MKININNKVDLPLQLIGEYYDKVEKKLKNRMNITRKIKYETDFFEFKGQDYKIKVKYNSTYISVIVDKLDVLAKPVYTKDLKFPKIPKQKH